MLAKLDEENFRSRKFLNASSYSKVTRECESRMIADHLQFLHGECREMVQKEKRHGKIIFSLREEQKEYEQLLKLNGFIQQRYVATVTSYARIHTQNALTATKTMSRNFQVSSQSGKVSFTRKVLKP